MHKFLHVNGGMSVICPEAVSLVSAVLVQSCVSFHCFHDRSLRLLQRNGLRLTLLLIVKKPSVELLKTSCCIESEGSIVVFIDDGGSEVISLLESS